MITEYPDNGKQPHNQRLWPLSPDRAPSDAGPKRNSFLHELP